MKKKILEDYVDACKLIEETEREIRKIENRKNVVFDKVSGSNPNWPYEPRSFNIGGTAEEAADASILKREEKILQKRKTAAAELKLIVEEWMNTVPCRMQRIIKYRVFEGLSWEKVAERIGRNATGEGVRMEYNRFMDKK